MINEEEMKKARREYEIKQAAAKRNAIEKTKSMRDRRLAADERKFLKEYGVEL